MGDRAAVLEADHLAKTYVLGFLRKKVKAITDVSFSVREGQIFALLGPNGAGKTTTLKILMGLVRSTSGQARVLSEPVGSLAAKQRLGYLPETPYFYEYLSGRELLVFMGKLFGMGRAKARRRADELLERVQMTQAGDMALRRYSKGMLQRIGLAQALINDPDLVILDEPLTGLDPLGRKDLRQLIAGLRDQGKTVVLSSHILSDVELLADEVVILVRGRSVNSGKLHDLLDARVLSTEVLLKEFSARLPELLAADGFSPEQVGQRLRVMVNEDQSTDRVLALAREHGAKIAALQPRKESLEDLVVKLARDPSGADDEDQARPGTV